MNRRESQLVRVYRLLLKGATTTEICRSRNPVTGGCDLASNWRARKTKIGELLRPMGGTFEKRKVDNPDGKRIYHYKIWMPPESDRQDPLGWLTKSADEAAADADQEAQALTEAGEEGGAPDYAGMEADGQQRLL